MKALKLTIFLWIVIILLNSCVFNSEISTYNDLAKEKTKGKIQIVTTDTTVYITESYSYNDSSISMIGSKRKYDFQSSYEGKLPFKDISYIQTKEEYFYPTLAYLGLNIFLIGNGVTMLSAVNGIEPIIIYSSGGSCPYIYSWNGREYHLEGEAFGTAFGKALETESSIVFKNLTPENKKLKLKITNERPETHFINKIEFTALELNETETVYSDNHNLFKIVKDHKKISKAVDRNNVDVTSLLSSDDNNYWKSDLTSAVKEFDFEDQLILVLNDIEEFDSLSLIVSSINTEISNTVFSYLQSILGDEFVNFTKAAETDQEIIEILKKTLHRCALKIDVWDGTTWKFVDLIYPEANRIKFQKLVSLPILKNVNNEMKIRLRSLCDVWNIDAINYDYNTQKVLIRHQPKLIGYHSDSQNDLSYLSQKDDCYFKLLPGQSINLEYEYACSKPGRKISYAIIVRGYLYEWIIDKRIESEMVSLVTNTPKIKLVKEVLKNIDSLLPIIYDNWRGVKKSMHS